MAQNTATQEAPQISSEQHPWEKQTWPLCHHYHRVSHEKIEDNTLVLIVDVRANKHQMKQAVKKLYDVVVAKVSTLIRPDGEKKAYVRLAPDYDALDITNKIGIT